MINATMPFVPLPNVAIFAVGIFPSHPRSSCRSRFSTTSLVFQEVPKNPISCTWQILILSHFLGSEN
jgi:hypothetical protein